MIEKILHKNAKPYLVCKDFLVSKESYELLYNQQKDMLVTSPIPSDLSEYYESEEYQSHNDSSRGFFNFLYQSVKKYSFSKKYSLFKKTNSSSKKILDIGTGTGEFLVYCKNRNWSVVGVEPNKKARALAQTKKIEVYPKLFDITNKKFDVITLWHVLEHIPNLHDYISYLKTLLKPNGKLLIAVPNFKSYDAQHYKEYWAAFDVPRHLWHFSRKSIKLIFKEKGFVLEKTYPLIFDSFYISLISEKYKTGRTNYIKSFLVGIKSNRRAKKSNEYSSLIYKLSLNTK